MLPPASCPSAEPAAVTKGSAGMSLAVPLAVPGLGIQQGITNGVGHQMWLSQDHPCSRACKD